MMTDIVLIAAVAVIIVDLSGVMDDVKARLGRWLGVRVERLKPFDCSFCVTFWAGLAYLLCTGGLTLEGAAAVFGAAVLTRPIGSALRAVVYALEAAVAVFNSVIDKLFEKTSEYGKKDLN